MQSFPSGHSTTTLAAAVYLCLYLNAKMKVFANYHTPMWKLLVLLLPILAAVLLVGTLIVDNTHSWWDVVAGATIGTLMALAAFRMVYASLFDWRINHIPLSRNAPFEGHTRPDYATMTHVGWQSPTREDAPGPIPEALHEGVGSGNDARQCASRQADL
jgi:diacylglycerol diphosphate phosphatase / phosphatidate phosphatase